MKTNSASMAFLLWRLKQFGVLLAVVGLMMFVTVYRKELGELPSYGYIGVFIACFAANSTVFLPAPSTAIVFAFASVYSPFWVAVVGGLGAATGEMFGYAAGYSGRQAVDTSHRGQQLKSWLDKHGMLGVFVIAFLPLPLFDILGVIAGASKMNLARFAFPTIAGKILKMLLYAYAGAGLLPQIAPYLEQVWKP